LLLTQNSAHPHLSHRAEKEGNAYFQRIGSQPIENDDVDMADVADDANALVLRWYEGKKVVRQTIINLMAVGIYHLVEQQLAAACQFYVNLYRPIDKEAITVPKKRDLGDVQKWFQRHFNFDLKDLASHASIDELRLVANTVKHGAGLAAKDLKPLRPDLFCDPLLTEYRQQQAWPNWMPDSNDFLEENEVVNPLGGEDLFVTENDLLKYSDAALSFFKEIAQSIRSHRV
jgi:hypothetical protein